MKQRSSSAAGTVPAAPYVVVDASRELDPGFLRSAEWGRKAILAGWLVAMAGIFGYVYTMLRAPENSSLLDAVITGGPIGWLSAVLILGGVASWVAGNIAIMRAMVDRRETRDETDD
jgi:hypothetical protein